MILISHTELWFLNIFKILEVSTYIMSAASYQTHCKSQGSFINDITQLEGVGIHFCYEG